MHYMGVSNGTGDHLVVQVKGPYQKRVATPAYFSHPFPCAAAQGRRGLKPLTRGATPPIPGGSWGGSGPCIWRVPPGIGHHPQVLLAGGGGGGGPTLPSHHSLSPSGSPRSPHHPLPLGPLPCYPLNNPGRRRSPTAGGLVAATGTGPGRQVHLPAPGVAPPVEQGGRERGRIGGDALGQRRDCRNARGEVGEGGRVNPSIT